MLIFDQLKKSDPQLRVLAWLVALGVAILLGGLWFLQVFSSRRYVESEKNQSFRSVRLPAARGRIMDRNGAPLAENRPSYNLSLYLEDRALRDLFQKQYREARRGQKLTRAELSTLARHSRFVVASNVVAQLSAILKEPLQLDEAKFHKHYEQKLALPLPIITGMTPIQLARVEESSDSPPGVDVDVQPLRYYPHKRTAAHVLGYLQLDNRSIENEEAFFNYRLPDYRGIAGVEASFNSQLTGRAGAKSVLVNNLGYRQPASDTVWAPVQPGRNVVLTIDLELQQAAEKALASAGANVRGAAIVMDVESGDILAMVSLPAYDPNDFSPRISHEEYQKLNDPKMLPLINRATFGAYPPGSIFKIITALACMENGLMREHEVIYNPGYFQLGRRTIGDTAPPGDYDFRRAFIKSSNTYFIHFGLKTGLNSILAMGHQFFLDERTGVPTHQEVSGFFPDYEQVSSKWFAGHLANVAIGQGITVTPLQMTIMAAAMGNGGKVLWPRLVERIIPQDNSFGEAPEVFPSGRVRGRLQVRPQSMDLVRRAMRADVDDPEGTGKAARVDGMDVCGKTGTAQVMKGNSVVDHITWFASFAPYTKARYAVVAMVESGGSGGGTCAPVVGKIYKAIQKWEQNPRPGMMSSEITL